MTINIVFANANFRNLANIRDVVSLSWK